MQEPLLEDRIVKMDNALVARLSKQGGRVGGKNCRSGVSGVSTTACDSRLPLINLIHFIDMVFSKIYKNIS